MRVAVDQSQAYRFRSERCLLYTFHLLPFSESSFSFRPALTSSKKTQKSLQIQFSSDGVGTPDRMRGIPGKERMVNAAMKRCCPDTGRNTKADLERNCGQSNGISGKPGMPFQQLCAL